MTKILKLFVGVFLFGLGVNTIKAQEDYTALNLLLNLGEVSAINVNYEFQVADAITVAPVALVDFDGDFGIGVKGTYYFDELFNLTDPWDTYAGLDLGYKFDSADFGIGIFIGGEWHIDEKWGLLLELGGGNLSFGGAVGAAVHF